MPKLISNLFILIAFVLFSIGCTKKNDSSENQQSPPAPIHEQMCTLIDLGEASDAIENALPNNQYVTIQGMSSPKTLVWQDKKSGQIYYATKLMGAQGRLFYMAKIKTGEKPTIKSSFTGTLMRWKHIEKRLLLSMTAQFREQWRVDVNVNDTYIIISDQKPNGCS